MYSSLLNSYINQTAAYNKASGNYSGALGGMNSAGSAMNKSAGGSYGVQTSIANGTSSAINKSAMKKQYMPSSAPVKIDTPEELKKKEKKKKIAKIALASAAILAVTVGSIAAFRPKGGLIQSARDFIKNIKHKTGGKAHPIPQGEFSAESLAELQKGADNINNAKDSVSRHFLLKVPGYSRFDKFVSDKYRDAALGATTKGWTKAKKGFLKTKDRIFSALNEAQDFDETKTTRIKELLEKRLNFINSASNPDDIKTRFTAVDKSLLRLDKDGWKRILKLKDEGVQGVKKLSKEALAEGRLNKAKSEQNKVLRALYDLDLSPDETNELKELLSELKTKSQTSFMSDFMSSSWLLKHAKNKESSDLFDKLRDINYGCAPTDIINMGLTTALLGVYTAQADSKEERVGVTLTTGIPLLVTLATTIIATNKMISGAKAMLMGLSTGFIANKIGKNANEKYKEKHNIHETPKTIVNIDDYMDTIKNAGESILPNM